MGRHEVEGRQAFKGLLRFQVGFRGLGVWGSGGLGFSGLGFMA